MQFEFFGESVIFDCVLMRMSLHGSLLCPNRGAWAERSENLFFLHINHLIIDHFDSGVDGTGRIKEASLMQCAVQVQQAAKTARALKHPTEGAAR